MDSRYDPDESTLLKLVSENMKEWDAPLDIEKLKKDFSTIDVNYNSTLTARQVCIMKFFHFKSIY